MDSGPRIELSGRQDIRTAVSFPPGRRYPSFPPHFPRKSNKLDCTSYSGISSNVVVVGRTSSNLESVLQNGRSRPPNANMTFDMNKTNCLKNLLQAYTIESNKFLSIILIIRSILLKKNIWRKHNVYLSSDSLIKSAEWMWVKYWLKNLNRRNWYVKKNKNPTRYIESSNVLRLFFAVSQTWNFKTHFRSIQNIRKSVVSQFETWKGWVRLQGIKVL